jgi:hypothetical protein
LAYEALKELLAQLDDATDVGTTGCGAHEADKAYDAEVATEADGACQILNTPSILDDLTYDAVSAVVMWADADTHEALGTDVGVEAFRATLAVPA